MPSASMKSKVCSFKAWCKSRIHICMSLLVWHRGYRWGSSTVCRWGCYRSSSKAKFRPDVPNVTFQSVETKTWSVTWLSVRTWLWMLADSSHWHSTTSTSCVSSAAKAVGQNQWISTVIGTQSTLMKIYVCGVSTKTCSKIQLHHNLKPPQMRMRYRFKREVDWAIKLRFNFRLQWLLHRLQQRPQRQHPTLSSQRSSKNHALIRDKDSRLFKEKLQHHHLLNYRPLHLSMTTSKVYYHSTSRSWINKTYRQISAQCSRILSLRIMLFNRTVLHHTRTTFRRT